MKTKEGTLASITWGICACWGMQHLQLGGDVISLTGKRASCTAFGDPACWGDNSKPDSRKNALSPPFWTVLQGGKELSHNQILSETAEEIQQVISGGTFLFILNRLLSWFLNCIFTERSHILLADARNRGESTWISLPLQSERSEGSWSLSGLVLLFFKGKRTLLPQRKYWKWLWAIEADRYFLKRFNHQSAEVPELPSTTRGRKSQANCSAKCPRFCSPKSKTIGKITFSHSSEKQIYCLALQSGWDWI